MFLLLVVLTRWMWEERFAALKWRSELHYRRLVGHRILWLHWTVKNLFWFLSMQMILLQKMMKNLNWRYFSLFYKWYYFKLLLLFLTRWNLSQEIYKIQRFFLSTDLETRISVWFIQMLIIWFVYFWSFCFRFFIFYFRIQKEGIGGKKEEKG